MDARLSIGRDEFNPRWDRHKELMNKLEQKLYYTTCGCLLSFANILLIDTRFNIVGIGFGITAAIFFIKALLIKADK